METPKDRVFAGAFIIGSLFWLMVGVFVWTCALGYIAWVAIGPKASTVVGGVTLVCTTVVFGFVYVELLLSSTKKGWLQWPWSTR